MGFSLTSPAPEKSDPTAKNRVWGFFGETPQSHRENRPQPKQPRQGDPSSLTKTVSGRTYWPSRDPIEEAGGENLYRMVGNTAINKWDYLGLMFDVFDVASSPGCTVGDESAITEYGVSVLNSKEIDIDRMLNNVDGLVSGVRAIQQIEGFGGLVGSVVQGGAMAGAAALNTLMSEAGMTAGQSYAVNSAASAVADNLSALVDVLKNSDMRGSIIVVYVTCCECVCIDPWCRSPYSKRVCDDAIKSTYVALRNGQLMTMDYYENGGMLASLPKRVIDINSLDLAIAERAALDSAKCNE
jgi:hypothetical protein